MKHSYRPNLSLTRRINKGRVLNTVAVIIPEYSHLNRHTTELDAPRTERIEWIRAEFKLIFVYGYREMGNVADRGIGEVQKKKKLHRLMEYLHSLNQDKFTGHIRVNFTQGNIGRVEKFEEVLKKIY